MASPAVSTPSSAGSPAAIAPAPPALAMKSINASIAAIAPAACVTTPGLITTKEWIVPPRPKPGRKPATDTPPTKRKAQNRAAQRAFRERRAARVGELEEQLDDVKEEHLQREAEFKSKISRLEADVERFSGELQSWKLRCDALDRIAEYEKREKESALNELSYLRKGVQSTGTDAVPLPPRHLRHHQPKILAPQPEQLTNLVPESDSHGCGACNSMESCACIEEAIAVSAAGCGKCTPTTHCQCLEDTIKEATELPIPSDLKRSHSPGVGEYSEKRSRYLNSSTPMEIDFTAQFASKSIVQPQAEPAIQSRLGESCGFCEEGTYCMCAEAAAAAAASNNAAQKSENRLAPILSEVTPPPSDTDVDGSLIKLPSLQPNHMHRPLNAAVPTNSCMNGPGTCQQCQSDPRSGLFCRSLAAIRASGSAIPKGCCGGNANGGDCCKSAPAATSQPPPSLSCADTYKTLSTHKNFDQASDELNIWLGRLNATPLAEAGRAPMEVEAASVMGVLKLFDRRFGRG